LKKPRVLGCHFDSPAHQTTVQRRNILSRPPPNTQGISAIRAMTGKFVGKGAQMLILREDRPASLAAGGPARDLF
jgi:hypothetical protein